MESIRLSFIVPIYNMELYLEECIESILKQNIKDSEIILVDDGSTDSSLNISEQYGEKYENIYVIHKKNEGISSARNAGLKVAKGKYVCFVDSDDFFKISFADNFLEVCQSEDLDIIRGWYGIYENEVDRYQVHPFPNISYANKTLSGYEFLNQSIKEHANEVVPWLGFFKREYILKHGIIFPEGIDYEEDHLFFLKALICDSNCRIYQSTIEFYAYRKRQGSATKTPTLKQIEDINRIVELETILIEKCNLPKKVKKSALKYVCSSFYQLTSIYGRLAKEDVEEAAQMTPFWIKKQCLYYAYDNHQRVKIFLFTFIRWFVDLVYDRRRRWN